MKSRNDLKIDGIEYIIDYQRNQLVILMECDLLYTPELNAFLQEKNLIIEAPRFMDYGKPFRTHLIKRETLSDFEKGGVEIGFSEVQLNKNFKYSMLSYKMIKDGLLKVILRFQKNDKQSTIYKNN